MKTLAAVVVIILIINNVGITAGASRDLPSYFPRCYRDDPQLNACLLKATDQVRPFLQKGVPELDVPPMEPFTIPEVTLEQGTSALNFKAVLTNINVTGLSSYKFSQFDFDVPKLQFFCKASVKQIVLKGKYKVTGKILFAPIEGTGTFSASIDNSNVTVYQAVKLIKKKGVEHLQPFFTNSSMQVGGPKAQLDGLFGGNEQLTKATNQVINENVDILFEDLKPVVEQVLTSIIEDLLLKAIANNVPFDKLYPVSKKINSTI